ncbi:MAG: sigma-70 family RNA polymerase sigma factor [Deltaproteobacteria bacterium]|nr:MAG: sigma-70 family RNA polymerase sigma factor [Deltaproteobacteria bacterium]
MLNEDRHKNSLGLIKYPQASLVKLSKKNEGNAIGSHYVFFTGQISEIQRLTAEDEFILGCKIQRFQDELAAKKLVHYNMKLAIKIAFQYRNAWANLMDLIQEALIGLSISSKSWNPMENIRFGSYALYWIKARLIKFLMINCKLVHIGNSRLGRQIYFEFPKLLKGESTNQNMDQVSSSLIKKLELNSTDVALVLSRLAAKEVSLSLKNQNSIMIMKEDSDPVFFSIQNQMRNLFSIVIQNFEKTLINERDRYIWQEHLMSNNPITLKTLGEIFGVSKQRMGQIVEYLKKSFKLYLIRHIGPRSYLFWLFSE